MTYRRAQLGFAAAILAALFAAGAACAQTAPRPAEVKLGMLASLTGNVAEVGRECQRGIDLALEEMTKAGRFKGTRVELTVADDASDANTAVVAVQRLSHDGVVGIVGGTVSSSVRAALPVAQRLHLPFVVVNAYTEGLTNIGDMVFQVSKPPSDSNRREVAEVARRLIPRKAALLWAQDNPTTVAFRNDFLAALKSAGIEVVVDEPMKALDTDFTSPLTKAMQAGADLLIPNFNAPQNATVIKQAHAIGYRPTTLGHVGDVSNTFISIGGPDVVGHIANSPFLATGTSMPLQGFVAAFKAKYGAVPTTPEAFGYQAMLLAGEAIGRMLDRGEQVSSENLRRTLESLGPQPSVMGSTGSASFVNHVFDYSGYVLILNDKMQWQEWK